MNNKYSLKLKILSESQNSPHLKIPCLFLCYSNLLFLFSTTFFKPFFYLKTHEEVLVEKKRGKKGQKCATFCILFPKEKGCFCALKKVIIKREFLVKNRHHLCFLAFVFFNGYVDSITIAVWTNDTFRNWHFFISIFI